MRAIKFCMSSFDYIIVPSTITKSFITFCKNREKTMNLPILCGNYSKHEIFERLDTFYFNTPKNINYMIFLKMNQQSCGKNVLSLVIVNAFDGKKYEFSLDLILSEQEDCLYILPISPNVSEN